MNSRPLPYQGSALPLSYRSAGFGANARRSGATFATGRGRAQAVCVAKSATINHISASVGVEAGFGNPDTRGIRRTRPFSGRRLRTILRGRGNADDVDFGGAPDALESRPREVASMTESNDPNAAARAARLAAALRENLKRRKVQAKGRVTAPGDVRPPNEDAPKADDES